MLEKETIILFNEEEDTVCVDTFNQKLINRLRKAKEKAPDSYQVDEPDRYGGVHAVVPKNLLRLYFATRSARNGVRKCLVSAKRPICRGHSPLHERIVER